MNNSHHHTSQAMGTFYFYNADAKLENNPYGFFSEFSDGNQSAMFHQQMQQQTLSINPPFPRPDSSASMPITPQTFQTTFQPHIAHINSNSMYQKPQFVNQDPVPRLMIDSTIQESDLFCFPTTPPLSASASVIGSPFLYQGLPTPINSTLFRIDNIKNNKIVPENLPLTEWVGCGSPPITPVFIQSNSLMNSTSEALPPHCQFLSPSPTPYPPPAPTHQPNFDYCDPRNLTVLPVGQISQPHIKTGPPGFSPDQTSFPANRDNSKVVAHSGLLVSDNYAKESCIPPLTVRSNQHIYDHQEEEFANGLIDYTPPSSCDSNTSKRRRSNSSSDATSLYGESFNSVAETKSLNASEVYAITCPPSPPLSISEGRAKNKKSIRKGRKTRPKNQLEAIKPIRPQNHSMGEKKEKNISGASNSRAINSSQTQIVSSDQQDAHTVDTIVPAPPTRRGRKESLTEDPSKTFGCAGCTRKFRRQEHMKRHFRSLHTSDRPFLCQECGKRFSRSDNLTQHSRTHGSGSIVMKVRKHREPSGSSSRRASTNNTIKSLGNTLYSTAAATSGSESDLSSQVSSSQALSSEFNSQSQKKRKRPA